MDRKRTKKREGERERGRGGNNDEERTREVDNTLRKRSATLYLPQPSFPFDRFLPRSTHSHPFYFTLVK